jgi:tetratricopeptide (TPR) repeat protein
MRGDADGALGHYQAALELDPVDAHALVGAAQVLLARGEPQRAEELLRRALDAHADLARAEVVRAGALVEQGRRGEARTRLVRAHELDPRAADAHFNLGGLALEDGDRATALTHLSEAARLDPNQPVFAYRLAWMLATDPDPAVRQPMRAVMLAERASDRAGQSDPWILDALGATYAAKGDHRLALDAAERALSLAEALGRTDLAREIAARIALYREGRAFIDG